MENKDKISNLNPEKNNTKDIVFGNKFIDKKIEKLELNEKEKLCQEYIESNKKTVLEGLTSLIKDKKFILIGEHHLEDCEAMRPEIMLSLPELKKLGLTHVVLEANTNYQDVINSLDFTSPEIKKILKEKGIGMGWEDGNFDILVISKLLDLRVLLIDHNDGREDKDRDNAKWQNERDVHMMETIQEQTDKSSKALIFIGSAHVHKKAVEGYKDGKVKRLGARLSDQYGREMVSSIRHVNKNENFDGLMDFMSQTPTPNKMSKGKKEVVILPDQGPIKGDERVSASDFIITTL